MGSGERVLRPRSTRTHPLRGSPPQRTRGVRGARVRGWYSVGRFVCHRSFSRLRERVARVYRVPGEGRRTLARSFTSSQTNPSLLPRALLRSERRGARRLCRRPHGMSASYSAVDSFSDSSGTVPTVGMGSSHVEPLSRRSSYVSRISAVISNFMLSLKRALSS